MSPERQEEFDQLERFMAYFAARVMGIDPSNPSHPSNTLRGIVAKFGKSKALEGLRQAVADSIEMTLDRPTEWIQQFDAECKASGIVTLSELRPRYWSKYKTILKRGRIKNETEYYLIAGIVKDSAIRIPEAERGVLDELVRRFEATVS
jgi:hypothetical protein